MFPLLLRLKGGWDTSLTVEEIGESNRIVVRGYGVVSIALNTSLSPRIILVLLINIDNYNIPGSETGHSIKLYQQVYEKRVNGQY